MEQRRTSRSRTNFGASRRNTSAASVSYFHKRSLGDKLQRLVELSPAHVGAVELLVDQILKNLKRPR